MNPKLADLGGAVFCSYIDLALVGSTASKNKSKIVLGQSKGRSETFLELESERVYDEESIFTRERDKS